MMYYRPQILDLKEISLDRPIYVRLRLGAEPQLFCVESVEPIKSLYPISSGGQLIGLNIQLNVMKDPYVEKR